MRAGWHRRAGNDSPGAGQVGARERSWSFEIRGRVFLGSEQVVHTWVRAICDAVGALTALELVRKNSADNCSLPHHLQHLAVNQLGAGKDGANVVLYSF